MGYTEAHIEVLLPSVWDRESAWGVYTPQAPDPDMPKAKYKNPKDATSFWTGLIDIRLAWVHAPLSMPERRALLLHYGFGWDQQEIATHQSVSQQAVSKRLGKGVDTLTEWLNAEYETEN